MHLLGDIQFRLIFLSRFDFYPYYATHQLVRFPGLFIRQIYRRVSFHVLSSWFIDSASQWVFAPLEFCLSVKIIRLCLQLSMRQKQQRTVLKSESLLLGRSEVRYLRSSFIR